MVVTTRSAERRLRASGKIEDLALRTKNEEASPSPKPSGLLTSTQTSPRPRTKISVHVPPVPRVRKATRLISSMTPNDEDTTPTQPSSDQPWLVSQTNASDSIDLAAGSGAAEQSETLSGPDSFKEIPSSQSPPSTPTAAQNNMNETESIPVPRSIETRPQSTATGQHKRLESEEPATQQQSTGIDATGLHLDSAAADGPSSDDDNDMPEILSSNTTKTKNSVRGKRRTRALHAATPETAANLQQPEADVPAPGPEFITPSLPKLDTNHENIAYPVTESASSDDSAFVTARTHRHQDVLATPSNISLDNDSSSFIKGASRNIESRKRRLEQSSQSTENLKADTTTSRGINPGTASVVAGSTTTMLPRKTGNTLENYRRQMLLNRAEKSRRSRNDTFRFEDDWAHKKRRFLISY